MSFTSPYPDVEIPNVSVYKYLFGGLAADDLDRPALIDGSSGAMMSFGELIGQIDAVAGALSARGLRVGDAVAVHVPNVPAFASVLHGILRAGGTATTVDVLHTAAEIRRQLADTRARFLFTISPSLPQALAAARSVGIAAERVIVLDGAYGHQSLADLLAEDMPAPQVLFDPARHLAVLPYTPGTTGNSKGVMLTHRNLVANLCQLEPQTSLGRGDRMLAVLPFFHIYGLTMQLNASLRRRATVVTMIRFDLAEFLRIAATQRCTYLPIAPPIAEALAKSPLVEDYDLSSVRLVLSGAAALGEQLGQTLADRLRCQVRQGYGMTEMSPASHGIPENRDDIPLGSVGLTFPNVQCKLIDPTIGDEIPLPTRGLSAPGELCCKGPNIMVGYLGNEAATAEVFDEQGFLRTGDLAVVNANGVVYIVDRIKELIKYKGYQVPPADLEALLLTHPQIADAAVIGVSDPDRNEIPKAFIARQQGADLDEEDVMAFVAARVEPHKQIRRVEFLGAIPKSMTGKILRKELRAREAARRTPTDSGYWRERDMNHRRYGSDGERELQEHLGTRDRAERFYEDQMLGHLNTHMMEFIRRMDMAFIATSDRHGECDASFRAGKPGFLHVIDERTIAYPEYRGNGVLASLGNILENPHVGILLIDFVHDLIGLHLNGSARIVEDELLRRCVPGLPAAERGRVAERWVVVDVEEAYIHCRKHIPHLVPAPRDQREWGTDNMRAKGGDFFHAKIESHTRPDS